MAQTIKLKRSATQNAVPSTSSLALGELAINTYDGKLFIKKNVSGTESIVTIGEVGANSIGPTELASTAVTAGSYGSTSAIPVITIDEDGRITSASTATISGLSANSVTSTEIAANAVGISELNVSDGTDGQVLTTDGNGNLAFEDQSGGGSAAAFSTNIASGDGSTTAFTLSQSPSAESKIIAFINGVFQNQDAYTISGTTLTFDTAPISGTNNVVVYVIGAVYSGESVLISNFSGNGTTTAFTLANNPGNENNTQVYIDGVYQQKTTYSVSGTTLTFSSAPPTGTNNIEVVMLTSTTVNTPAAGSVVTASMADDSVTASKIVSSAVTTAKIADSNVTTAKIADSNVTTEKIADDAVTIGKIADAALVIESEGISSNDNDTTLPTSAAVKDYVDTQVAGKDALSELSGDTDDVTEGSTNLYFTNARADARITNALKDEDNMASNSATHIPSQQSVKAYVDSQVASKDALSELSGDTDDVSEGSTNLYFTNARVDARLLGNTITSNHGIVADNDGNKVNLTTDGSIEITRTAGGPYIDFKDSTSEDYDQRIQVTSGNFNFTANGLSINGSEFIDSSRNIDIGSGAISSGAITSTGEVEATALDINGDGDISGNLILGGYLAGPATFTIDPAAVGNNTGTVVIAGNLQVDGTTTTINSTTMEVDDLNITLASGAANAAAADGAGLTVDGASATITYDGTNDEWDFNKDINVTGTITSSGNITGTLATAAQPNITSVGTLTGLTTTGNINFGDNDKAVFGASSDLQIFHDGSNSYIQSATGNFNLTTAGGNEFALTAANDGAVKLYYNGSEKLATTDAGALIKEALTIGSSSNSLGTTAGDQLTPLTLQSDTSNGDFILFTTERLANGSNWETAAHRIQRKVDVTKMGYIQFGSHSDDLITFGKNNSEYGRFSSSGDFGVGESNPLYKLHVSGGAGDGVYVDGTQNTSIFLDSDNNTTGPFTIRVNSDTFHIKNQSSSGFNTGGSFLKYTDGGSLQFLGDGLVVTSSDFVSIGHTDPDNKLHIQGAGVTGGIFVEDSNNSSASPVIIVQGNRADANESKSFSGGLALSALQTSALANDGKHIGTIYFGTNHTDGTAANIAYSASISAELSGDANSATDMPTDLVFYTGSTGSALGTANTNFGTERMRIDSSGSVGIGTSSPSDLLDVRGDGADTYIRVGSDTAAGNDAARIGKIDSSTDFVIQASLGTTSSNTIFKRNTTVETVRIDSSGNVAIGDTSSRSFRLYIENAGSAGAGQLMLVDSDNNTLQREIRTDAGVLSFDYWDSSNRSNHLTILANGNVGIGQTNPARPLHISGATVIQLELEQTSASSEVRMALDAGGTSGQIQFAGASHASLPNTLTLSSAADTRFVQAGQTVMYIDSGNGGRVGIGTDNPSAKLDVDGTIKLNGNYPVASGNVVLGNAALDDASLSGNNNVAIGSNAMSNTTSGGFNVGIGVSALISNTTGTANTAVGNQALKDSTTPDNNTGIGSQALYLNTTGTANTAVGSLALDAATTPDNNTAVGYAAMTTTTTGGSNTAVGGNSLELNTTGSNNTAIGRYALHDNTTGIYNTAVGWIALGNNTTGNSSTAVGMYSLRSSTGGGENTALGYKASYLNTTGLYNVAVGVNALLANTTANRGTAVGHSALSNNTTGAENTAVGFYALLNNGTGNRNVAVGDGALDANTSASDNTAMGQGALGGNTTGTRNTAVGQLAANDTTTGNDIVAMGQNTLALNTTGSNNTAIGRAALEKNTTANNNTAVGYHSLLDNVTGTQNTAVGSVSLANNTATGNSAFGFYAARFNTTGVENTAIGRYSLYNNTTGSYNTAVGNLAMQNGTVTDCIAIGAEALRYNSGNRNIAIGNEAGLSATGDDNIIIGDLAADSGTFTGSDNIIIGKNGGTRMGTGSSNTFIGNVVASYVTSGDTNVGIGGSSLFDLTTADRNTAVGTYSGQNITTGVYNTAIGYNSSATTTTGSNNTTLGYDSRTSGANAQGQISIGSSVTGTTNNRVHIGNSSSHIYANYNSNATWTHSSDERAKKDIMPSNLGLDFINDLKPVTYKFKAPSEYPTEWQSYDVNKTKPIDEKTHHGMIAQDIKKALDKSDVNDFEGWDVLPDGKQQISESMFVFPLIKAVQELSSQVDELKQEIKILKGE